MTCEYCTGFVDEDEPGWGYWIADEEIISFHLECLQQQEDVVLA